MRLLCNVPGTPTQKHKKKNNLKCSLLVTHLQNVKQMQNQFSVTGEISTLFGTTAADLTLNTRPKTQKKKKYVEPQYNNVK